MGVTTAKVKPGWTTTEFWHAVVVTLLSLLLAFDPNLLPGDFATKNQALISAVALVAASLASAGYSESRGRAKQAVIVGGVTVQAGDGEHRLEPGVEGL